VRSPLEGVAPGEIGVDDRRVYSGLGAHGSPVPPGQVTAQILQILDLLRHDSSIQVEGKPTAPETTVHSSVMISSAGGRGFG